MAEQADLEALAEEISRLAPPDQIRLAADLLERKRPKMAYAILSRATTELGAALALVRRPLDSRTPR